MSETAYVLHIWPPNWSLQSLDPTCLAAVMYLQLTIPGQFRVALCTNPDQSPNGQLPFLSHAHTTISTFPSIVAFISSLAKSSRGVTDLDASLTKSQRAEKVARYAHVEAYVSDLVSHLFYGNDANFWGLTNPALASKMPIPQKYYVARRIREAYRPRLEAAGLWSLPNADEEKQGLFEKNQKKKKVDFKTTSTRAFEREKMLDKAKTALAVHSNYLQGKQFFFGDHPSSLDVYLAAHILLVADPPFPDAVLQIQLLESFPDLVAHASRIQAEVALAPAYDHDIQSGSFLSSLIPRRSSGHNTRTQTDPADVAYTRRSLLFALAAAAMAAVYSYSLLISVGDSEDNSEDGEEGEEGGGESADGAVAFADEDEE